MAGATAADFLYVSKTEDSRYSAINPFVETRLFQRARSFGAAR
jgi:hypothetical protein